MQGIGDLRMLAAAGAGMLPRPRARIIAAMRSASPAGRPCRRTRSSTSRTGRPTRPAATGSSTAPRPCCRCATTSTLRQLQPALLLAQSGGQDRAGDDLPGQRGRRALCGAVSAEVVGWIGMRWRLSRRRALHRCRRQVLVEPGQRLLATLDRAELHAGFAFLDTGEHRLQRHLGLAPLRDECHRGTEAV